MLKRSSTKNAGKSTTRKGRTREKKEKNVKLSNSRIGEYTRNFVSWYEKQTKGKGDWQINWIELGDEAYKRYRELLINFDLVAAVEPDAVTIIATPLAERCYVWEDTSGVDFLYERREMVRERAVFLEDEEIFDQIGTRKYKLKRTGKQGNCSGYKKPFKDSVPYLSFAWKEKRFWNDVCGRLKRAFC
jgi:hypothetical protein